MRPLLPFRSTSFHAMAMLAMAAGALLADSNGLEAPSIGLMRDVHGAWHRVLGIPGNFVLSEETDPPSETSSTKHQIEQRGAAWFVVDEEGAVLDALPAEATAPILLLDDLVIYAASESLVMHRANAADARLDCGEITALRSMSNAWVQVSTIGREYALRVEAGREALFVLPETPRLMPETRGVRRR